MITYVNTVLVGKGKDSLCTAAPTTADAGKYVIMDVETGSYISDTATSNYDVKKFKIGLVTSKVIKSFNHKTGVATELPVVKWSNDIIKADIKSYNTLTYTANVPEKVEINFASTGAAATITELAKGNKRVVVRLTFKDLPTRYRKWTESYEYVTVAGDTATTIATKLAAIINKEWKRARVTATTNGGKLILTAMPYTDDDKVDTINVANTIRFSANAYYTDPAGSGFASKNKYSLTGVEIKKTPGEVYAADAKLVRDREAQAMGYEGILNRSEGTWPIIRPDMNVDLTKNYDAITLEFENMYRAADDIFRKTKQTVEIYDVTTKLTNLKNTINSILKAPVAAANTRL